MKLAFLLEEYGPPWNEGYKNLAKYTIEMLARMSLHVDVIPSKEVSFQRIRDYDLIQIFNHKIKPSWILKWKKACPVVKEFAKMDIEGVSSYFDVFPTVTKADLILTTTHQLQKDIGKIFPCKEIECLPIPLPVASFSALDRFSSRQSLAPELDRDEKLVIYTGRINAYRNIELFFAAGKLFSKRCKFLFALSHPPPRELVLPDDITMLQSVSDVRKLYSAADLLVYPVERRGAIEPPLTILEAMSAGCVVAATRNPITSDIISERSNGFLFSNLSELSQIISEMLEDRMDFDAIRERARQSVRSRYDFPIVAEKYLDFYKRVQDRNGRHQ